MPQSDSFQDKRLPKFVDADKAAMRKAGAVLSPAVVAALSHSDMTISRENISARNLKSRSILQFSASVFKVLLPSL